MRILFIVAFTIIYSYANNNELFYSGNCSGCHFKHRSISAPSIEQIKERYITAFPNKEEFINYMSVWVKTPNVETSLMHDSIKQYKIMPELGFDLDTLRKISQYIYENDFKSTSNEINGGD